MTDVGQNSHGLRVQQLYKRSILNSFHAVWSVGTMTGGLMGGAAVALAVPGSVHLSLNGLLWIIVAARPRTGRTAPFITLAARVVIAVGGTTLAEDAGSTGTVVHLSGPLGASVSIAAPGFVTLVGAQFIGRLLGEGLMGSFGMRAVARA